MVFLLVFQSAYKLSEEGLREDVGGKMWRGHFCVELGVCWNSFSLFFLQVC